MCGGITVWSALTYQGIKPNDAIGIVGLGGLGHLAVQFARAMGLEVVVFSSTDSKKQQAFELGASHFVATKGQTELSFRRSSTISWLLRRKIRIGISSFQSWLAARPFSPWQ